MNDLTTRLERLHEEDRHGDIAALIEALPPGERDYGMQGAYARALNNLDREGEALTVLEALREEGEEDPLWHYRIGYSLYYLDRDEEAARHLRRAIDLGDDEEDTRDLFGEAVEHAARDMDAAEHYRFRWDIRPSAKTAREPFAGFDLTYFWDDSDYAVSSYVSEPPDDALIAEVEAELGYKLPASYIWLMKRHNGGVPRRTAYPSARPTSWAEDHVAVSGIFGIGRGKDNSLRGDMGSEFMIEEWEYPDIGVAIGDCPSGGHDMIFLDYTGCGRDGEPAVVHVDQERDFVITYLADDFESFIRGLVGEETYAEEDGAPFTAPEFDPHRVVDGRGAAAVDGGILLADMTGDEYYPAHLVEKVRSLLLDVAAFIGGVERSYGEVQQKLDEAVWAINDLEEEFDDAGSEIETVARESIADSVQQILAHFGVEIDTEQAVRERDW